MAARGAARRRHGARARRWECHDVPDDEPPAAAAATSGQACSGVQGLPRRTAVRRPAGVARLPDATAQAVAVQAAVSVRAWTPDHRATVQRVTHAESQGLRSQLSLVYLLRIVCCMMHDECPDVYAIHAACSVVSDGNGNARYAFNNGDNNNTGIIEVATEVMSIQCAMCYVLCAMCYVLCASASASATLYATTSAFSHQSVSFNEADTATQPRQMGK